MVSLLAWQKYKCTKDTVPTDTVHKRSRSCECRARTETDGTANNLLKHTHPNLGFALSGLCSLNRLNEHRYSSTPKALARSTLHRVYKCQIFKVSTIVHGFRRGQRPFGPSPSWAPARRDRVVSRNGFYTGYKPISDVDMDWA